jgi:polyferredoxin
VCPTGIDIRNGLQMECINCTACIDACDAVMTKVGRPLGLIRYASQSQLEGKPHRVLRPRVVIYTALLIIAGSVLAWRLSSRAMSEFQIVRGGLDVPYSEARPGVFINHLHLRLTNKGREARAYYIEGLEFPDEMKLVVPVNPYPVPGDATVTVPIFVEFPGSALAQGKRKITIRVRSDKEGEFSADRQVTVLGPGG